VKNKTTKNIGLLKAWLLLLISGLVLIVSFFSMLLALIRRGLTYCEVRLENPYSFQIDKAIKKIEIKTPEKLSNESEPESTKININDFCELLNQNKDDERIDEFRKAFENLDVGYLATQRRIMPHIYAVYQPNKAENLQRIRNVLCELDMKRLIEVLHFTEKNKLRI
jgi:hypothetical protein